MRVIEVVVGPQGQTTVQTKGFAGSGNEFIKILVMFFNASPGNGTDEALASRT